MTHSQPLGRTALGADVIGIANRRTVVGVGPVADLTVRDILGEGVLPAWPLDSIELDGQAAR